MNQPLYQYLEQWLFFILGKIFLVEAIAMLA